MAYKIELDAGIKEFDVKFKNSSKVKKIYFNPLDTNLYNRFIEGQKKASKIQKEISEIELDEQGQPVNDKYIEITEKSNKYIYDIVDEIFNSKISKVIFSECAPFSKVNGNFFVINFFETIGKIIVDIINEEGKKINPAILEHLKDYSK